MRTFIALLLLAAGCAGSTSTTSSGDAAIPDAGSSGIDVPGAADAPEIPDATDVPEIADAAEVPDASGTADVPGASDADGVGADATSPPPDVGTAQSQELAAPGPYAVGFATLELVDASRSTPANGDYVGAPTRTLVTDVYYPATGEPGAVVGRVPVAAVGPLVVYSHGYMSTRTENAHLFSWLASHGVVVAAPTFPLTSQGAPGGPTIVDLGNQPGDVSFIIDRVIAESAGGELDGALGDAPRIAAAGLSLGALTTALVVLHPDLRDARIEAFALIGGPLCLLPPAWLVAEAPPALLVYGTADQIVPYEANGHAPFLAMPGPRLLASIAGGTHVGFASSAAALFDGIPDPDGIGCSALEQNLADQSFEDLATEAGFDGLNPDLASCPAACAGPPPTTTLGTKAQAALQALTVGAFLRAELTDDAALSASLLGYLTDVLPAEHPEVTVEGSL
jgi:predicted dienelactone hydrolase